MNAHITARINSSYSEFSSTEKKIADYILSSPQIAMEQSIDQIAEELNVAISSVFRFSKRLGFKGFQAMKIAIASEISGTFKEMVDEKITENDNEQVITEKIFNNNIRMFRETIQVMDFSSLKKAINVILAASHVEFFGVGNASVVAIEAHHKFIGSGISTSAYGESSLQLKTAVQLNEGDAAVLICHSGTDPDILRILDILKGNGVATIAVTKFSASPLSKKVDAVLYTVSNEMENSDDLYSRIIQMSIIDSLYVNVTKAIKTANAKKDSKWKLSTIMGKNK